MVYLQTNFYRKHVFKNMALSKFARNSKDDELDALLFQSSKSSWKRTRPNRRLLFGESSYHHTRISSDSSSSDEDTRARDRMSPKVSML